MPVIQLSTVPASQPHNGDMYFDMATGTIRVWYIDQWKSITEEPVKGWTPGMKAQKYHDRWDLED